MKLSKINKPRILLVGAGKFGWKHLLVWQKLASRGLVTFVGVVVRDPVIRKKVGALKVPVFSKLTDEILKTVDAVDIVTPAGTHFDLAKECLIHTNVFLEKPMTLSAQEARELNQIAAEKNRYLALGHIYRFNGAIQKLKKIMAASPTKPFFIESTFVDIPSKLPNDCGILFSDLHGFDILDYLLESSPELIYAIGSRRSATERFENNATVLLRYPNHVDAVVKLSWTAVPKTRSMTILFPDKRIFVDLADQIITVTTLRGIKKIGCFKTMPLEAELANFVEVLKNKPVVYADGTVGLRLVHLTKEIERSYRENRPISFHSL
ncbi:MAG: Gfo/Idh/MocA family oxidoreductase [Patescibacteria group bacterium]|jgi:predicted dehydrogenase